MMEKGEKKKVYPFAHCVGQEGYTLNEYVILC